MSNLLSQASLVMIPSGYKEDVVYSQIPTSGAGDLSFTRASNGTRINSAGLVEVVPWNLVQQSETLSVSPWGIADVTITDNSQTAPNGTTSADVLTEGTGSAQHRIYQTTSFASGIYTLSVYVKNITGTRQAYIDLGPVTGFFNFATETIYSASAIATFEKLANGWYRIALTTANAITLSTIYLGLGQNNSETYTGNGTSAIAFYGAQLNIGSTAKPYFPTTDRLNVPRLTYQNGGGGCPSLLLEKQSTNYIFPSEDFANGSYWFNSNGASATANQTISPDGTQNADKISFPANSAANLYNFPTTVIGSNVFSIYAKTLSGTKQFRLRIDTGSGPAVSSDFTATTTWQRFDFLCTTTATNLVAYVFNDSAGTAGDLYVWGAQLEASSYPTSYIPTTSSSATRVADECFKTGISSLIGQTEGVIFVDIVMKNDLSSVNRVVSITESNWLSGGSIRVDIQIGTISVDFVNGNASIGAMGYNTSFTPNTRYKIAVAYKTNDCALYMNGTQLSTNTSIGTMPTCSELYLNELGGGFGGPWRPTEFNQVALFPTRLTNAELASLTTI